MAKINFLTAYPTATPAADSIVIGSLAANGATNNFLMSAIATYVMGANTLTLQDVCDNGTATTTGMTIADTLTLSKATGTGLSVTSNVIIGGDIDANGRLSVAELVHAELAVGTGLQVTANATIGGTANIADTLTLSKATGIGLDVTSSVSVGGQMAAGTSVVGQASVLADGFQTNNGSFTATSSAVSCSFGTAFSAFGATISDTLNLTKATGNGLMVTSDIFVGGDIGAIGSLASNGLNLQPSTPASSAATGIAGDVKVDATYIYVCVGTNSWGRVAIDTTPF